MDNDKNSPRRVYNAVCDIIDEYKSMAGLFIFYFILVFIGNCFLDKEKCKDSIIDMTKPDKSCYNGAKLKHVNDQWVCSCEK